MSTEKDNHDDNAEINTISEQTLADNEKEIEVNITYTSALHVDEYVTNNQYSETDRSSTFPNEIKEEEILENNAQPFSNVEMNEDAKENKAIPPVNQQILASPESKPERPLLRGNSLKQWGIASYKCMRQSVFERIGRSSKTIDFVLEEQIANIQDMQKMYAEVLRSVQKLHSHFESLVHSQQALGSVFTDLLPKSPELEKEISSNVKTQQSLSNNGELLLSALTYFINSLSTLCDKTIVDTLATAKHYEIVRLEYDAYRNDFESLTLSVKGKTKPFQVEEARQRYLGHKEIFERIRADVHVKIKFLEDNRIKVMQKLMVLLHNSISSYFTGNQSDLEMTLKQFGIKLPGNSNYTPVSELGSWLEFK